jgi:2-keto-4-pentenoate hydratase/2-oxohepta-3-ene-1,7-dioic acid hydratase in catechol pathway
MRFASYLTEDKPGFGLVTPAGIVDLADRAPSLKAAIASGSLHTLGREAALRTADLREEDVTFLPVIGDPAKIFCVGLNYEMHRQETGRAVVGHPTIFTRFADTQGGHDGEIVLPHVSTMLDFEGELAVIIGKGGRYIPEADAWTHVAGYACYNDASVRDWQNHTHQYTPGKNFPTTGPFGPYLVTPDEVGEIGPQTIQTRLNGETVQSATLGDMIFSIPVIIAYLSAFTPLSPGDVIATGTPGGVGFKREPQLFMKPGDVVEVEIEKVGLLRSRIVAETD